MTGGSPSSPNLDALLREGLRRTGGRPALRWKRFGLWHPVSGDEASRHADAIAAGLRGLGLGPGDVVGVFAGNCVEWVLADLGALRAGCVPAGYDAHCDADELRRLLGETKPRILFVEGERRLRLARRLREAAPGLERIVLLRNDWGSASSGDVLALAELEKAAPAATQGTPHPAPAAANAPAIVVCTSGMTGPVRAVPLSHGAVYAQVARAGDAFGLRAGDERLLLAPLHHVLERVTGVYAALASGVALNFPEGVDTALADMAELQPSIVQAPPRLWATLRSGIELALKDATPFQRRAVRAATGEGGAAPGFLADRLVRAPLRRRMGLDGARLCLSVGAPCHPDLARWFARLGVDLWDVYGTAEAGGAVAATPLGLQAGPMRFLPGIEASLGESGELRLRAPDLGGDWIRTGDRAVGGEGGVVASRGRLAHGWSGPDGAFDPFEREQALRASPYVADAFVSAGGDGALRATILLDFEHVARFAQDGGIPFTHVRSLAEAAEVRALIDRLVADVNRAFGAPTIESTHLFARAVAMGDPELGPMMSLRRHRMGPPGRDAAPAHTQDVMVEAQGERG